MWKKSPRLVLISVLLVLAFAAFPRPGAEAATTPTINGLIYGDGDIANYDLLAKSIPLEPSGRWRGNLYARLIGGTLYVAVVEDRSVNDNVFGNSSGPDQAYLDTAGWGSHTGENLIGSDHMQFSLSCGASTWIWKQDYVYDADGDKDPAEADWKSDVDGGDGGGTPPPHLLASASSFQWDLNNYASDGAPRWDVTLGGTRIGTGNWKSPATLGAADTNILDEPGYPALPDDITFDSAYNWEWPIVYEFSVNVAADCGSNPITVEVITSHNSPSKDGTGGVPFEPEELIDYGDAPESYGTLLADNGARHILLANGPFLGPIVDADTDGQPNAAATGDDLLDGLDDEDGVFPPSVLLVGKQATIGVTGTGGAKLDAWIDFNGNGVFTDPGEQVATSASLSGALDAIALTVPAGANPGTTYARFRVSTAGGLAPTGQAANGEVEDYAVTIALKPEPKMVVAKDDGVALVTPGDTVTYLIQYSNIGDAAATNVTITDVLPDGMTYVIANPAPTSVAPGVPNPGATTVVWNLPDAVPAGGGPFVISLTASVDPDVPAGTFLTNGVTLCYEDSEGTVYPCETDDDTDEVIEPGITKQVDKAQVCPGETLNYTLQVGYTGSALLHSVTVSDTIPAGTTYLPGSINAGGTYDTGSDALSWDLGSNVPAVAAYTAGAGPCLPGDTTGRAVYADNTTTPKVRLWDGSALGAESSSLNLSYRYRIEAGASAPNRNESIVMGVDSNSQVRGEYWDGLQWTAIPGNPLGTVSESYWWGADVAYLQAGGTAVMAWNDNSQPAGQKLRYRLFSGSAWTAPAAITAYTGAEPQQMHMEARPSGGEVLLVVNDSNADDYAIVGNADTGWGNAVTLDTSGTSEPDQTALFAAYESQTGRALVAYGKTDSKVYYRIWNGSTWSAEASVSAPGGVILTPSWITLASDPRTNRIVLGVLTNGGTAADIWLNVWSGTAWGTSTLATGTASGSIFPAVAVAFEGQSGHALAAYGVSASSSVYYRTWASGSGWTVQQTGPTASGGATNSMILDADANSDRVMLSVQDAGQDLNYVLWNGLTWGSRFTAETGTGEIKNQPFLFLWDEYLRCDRSVSLTIPASADTQLSNMSPTYNYGTCQTIESMNQGSPAMIRRPLVAFDLPDLSATCTVNSAMLDLYAYNVAQAGTVVNVHRLTNGWAEGTVCAAAGTANWTNRLAGVPWTTAGGDFDPVAAASTTVNAAGTYSFDLTGLAQAWVDGTYANYGVLLDQPTNAVTNGVAWWSSEFATPAQAPKLRVTFTCPAAGPSMGNTMDAMPRLARDGDLVTVTMALTATLPTSRGTVDTRVVGTSNDAEEEGPDGLFGGPGYMYLNSTDLEITQDMEPAQSGTQVVGMRFAGVNIPKGATVTAARITFRAVAPDAPNNNTGPTNLAIQAQASDNAPTFTSTRYNLSTRARTVASVAWAPAAWTTGLDYDTPDLKSVVQEIVNRAGWADGNSMVFIVTGTGSRSAASYDGDAANAPRLHIEWQYTNPGVPASPLPLVVNGTNGVSATWVSGPTPASAPVGLDPALFTWVYQVVGSGSIGQLTFSGQASDGTDTWPVAQSNSVIVVPPLTFQVTVDGPPPTVQQVRNVAYLYEGTNLFPPTPSNEVITLLWQVDLELTKSALPEYVALGDTLNYTLDVKNNGPDDATGVVITDRLPPGTRFVSAAPSQGTCAHEGSVVTCDLGDLMVNATAQIGIVVVVERQTLEGELAEPAAGAPTATVEQAMPASQVEGGQPEALPIVNGLIYGDGDIARYDLLGKSVPIPPGTRWRGNLYARLAGGTLYVAMVEDRSVNDNVFGNSSAPDIQYQQSAGWDGQREADKLIGSDHMEFKLTCGASSWTWKQDYVEDADGDKNPAEADWVSDHLHGSGSGTPPPHLLASASSFQWDLNNYASGGSPRWDVTLGGTRSGTSAWKSPATLGAADTNILDEPGYPALPDSISFDSVHGWEWPVVYEFAVNVAADCGSNPVSVEVISAHNSPSKDGTSDVPVPPIGFVDYGDAPSPYPTLLANNGARHTLLPTGLPFLGAIVDADADGQPNAAATGDDLLDGLDDEDGVTFVADLYPGTTAPIQVLGSAGAKLNAWIDFNDNGVWTDAGETIANNLSLSGGVDVINVTVPLDAVVGTTYARFRVSTAGGLTPSGLAPNGEVEDYAVTIGEARLSLGDTLWRDTDNDGRLNGGEVGIQGVTVQLFRPGDDPQTDPPLATRVTNASGYYLFDNLLSGNYFVYVPASQFAPGAPLEKLASSTGNDPAPDPDDDVNNDDNGAPDAFGGVTTGAVTLAPASEPVNDGDADNMTNLAVDLGFTPKVDRQVIKIVDNPVPDEGATIVYTVTARNNGPADTTEVVVSDILPPGVTYVSHAATKGTYDPVSGKWLVGSLANGASAVLTITATVDSGTAGFTITNEATITGKELDLVYWNDHDEVDIVPRFGCPPGTLFNRACVWGDECDSNPFNNCDHTCTPIVEAAIGNYVWLDENSDGYQDAGEPGIPNVRVLLKNSAGAVISTTYTDVHGGYLFRVAPSATPYFIHVDETTLPKDHNGSAGLTQTAVYPQPGSDLSNQDQSTGFGYAVTVGAGQQNLTADFGYNWNPRTCVVGNDCNAALGDRVWIDADGDGAQDPAEIGIPGVVLKLYHDAQSDGVYNDLYTVGGYNPSATTDATGGYMFRNLPAGAYVVRVDVSNFGSGAVLQRYRQTGDPDHFGTTGYNDNQTTSPVVISPGDVFVDADFGYQPAATSNTVGDRVWLDADNDTVQDTAEPGIQGVVVQATWYGTDGVLGTSDDVVYATVTDAGGKYLFTGLPDGTFRVTTNTAGNFAPSGPLQGLVQTYDATSPTNNHTSTVTVVGGQTNLLQDFGYSPSSTSGKGAVGDTIFHDLNGNGLPDDREGIPGVRVILYDSLNNVVGFTYTDAFGIYGFGNLNASASYKVKVDTSTLPPGLTNSVDPDGGTPNESSVNLTFSPNGINLDQDFGYVGDLCLCNTIGDRVWLDVDRDGVQDVGEPGIADVVVQATWYGRDGLLGTADDVIYTTVTSATPHYEFTCLPNGTFDVTTNVSGNFALGGPLAGLVQSYDATVPTDDHTSTVTVTGGQTNLDQDFGYSPSSTSGKGAIGDTIFYDANGDGLPELGEGIPGVKVLLYDGGNNLVATAYTDVYGIYGFGNLNPSATYKVKVDTATLPSGLVNTVDPDGGTPNESTLTLGACPACINLDQDFGYQAFGSIGDTLWFDANANGTGPSIPPVDGGAAVTQGNPANPADSRDYGIPAVTVALIRDTNQNGVRDAGEPIVGTTVTNAAGQYLFAGLPFGSYLVWVDDTDNVLFGLQQTWDADGVLGSPDLSAASISLAVPRVRDQDFGYAPLLPLGSIGDTVWYDVNNSGGNQSTQGVEPGIPGVVVRLYLDHDGDGVADDINGDGAVTTLDAVSTTVTDGEGHYLFGSLPLETYLVQVDTSTLPAGFNTAPTYQPPGASNSQAKVTLTATTPDRRDQDFSYFKPGVGSLGDLVWGDLNRSGTAAPDSGEPGLGGVTVRLYDGSNNQVATTTTNAYGLYLFADLPYGTYTVAVDETTLPDGFVSPATYDPAAPLDGRSTATISAGSPNNLSQDFSYPPAPTPLYSIGDTVWFDQNNSGGNQATQGAEPGLADVVVKLYDGAGTLLSARITDANGNYVFSGLAAGTYKIQVDTTTLPPYVQLISSYELDTNGDSQVTLMVGPSNQAPRNVDFSYPPLSTAGAIGDTVFLDANTSFTFEPGEGMGGITVNLYAADGTTLLDTTTTDKDGYYYFGGLDPRATYVVKVDTTTLPPGLGNSVDPDGGNDSKSIVNLATSGPVNLFQDFGYIPAGSAGSIGNLIWTDSNADGINQGPNGPDGLAGTDDDEPPLAGITLELYHDRNGNGRVDPGEPSVATASTAADGSYLFRNLPVNDGSGTERYVVNVTDTAGKLAGWWHSLGNQSQSSDNTSKLDPYGVILSPGTPNILTADFGYYVEPAALGNRVWLEGVANGLQESGEHGIAGVLVTLKALYPNGTQTTQVTTTDRVGYYSFGNLLLDENYNRSTAGDPAVDHLPKLTISVNTAQPALIAYGTTTIDVSGNTRDKEDCDNPAGVVGMAVQGLTDTSPGASPASEPTIASYDFGFRIVPTAVVILSFTAVEQGEAILVQWVTEGEIANAGFNLYRSDSLSGEKTMLNDELIPSQVPPGTPGGATYEFVDGSAEQAVFYYYWLESVDVNGQLSLVGPATGMRGGYQILLPLILGD